MTIIESGVIGGALAGATIGGGICKSLPIVELVGGVLAGVMLGGAAGWIYALVVISLLAFFGVLWRAAAGRLDGSPEESDMAQMTSISVFGTFAGFLVATITYFRAGWAYALLATAAAATVASLVAVGRCELTQADRSAR